MAKNIFFEEICDGVLCKAAERFEDEVEEGVYLNLSEVLGSLKRD